MESYDILVVILSVSLAIFLVTGTVALVLLIKILKKVRVATESAQHAVENVEEFTSNLKSAGKATAVGTYAAQIAKFFKKEKK